MSKVFDVIAKLGAVDNMSKAVQGAVGKSQQSLDRFAKNANKFGSTMFGVGAQAAGMAVAVGAPLVKMALDAEKAATANARLEQVFRSMGETSGQSAKQAAAFAESLMFEIAVDDNEILATQAKLATFENVIKNTAGSSEIFERATKAAFDMAATGLGDASGLANQLGKALNDPINGMQALGKAGTLTKADIKRIGDEFNRTGNLMAAQQEILSAVEKQYGGVAAATADDSAKIGVAFTKISETLGAALLPIMADLATFLTGTAIPAIKQFVADYQPIIGIALKAAAGLAAFLGVVSVGSFAIGGIAKVLAGTAKVFGLLSSAVSVLGKAFFFMGKAVLANPIVAAIALIVGAVVAMVIYWDEFNAFLNRQPAFIQGIMRLFTAPIRFVAGVVRSIMSLIQGDFSGALDRIIEAVSVFNIVEIFGLIMQGLWDFFGSLGARFYEAGSNIVSSITQGIKDFAMQPVNAISDMVSSMRDYLPFSPAKVGPFRDLDKLQISQTIAKSIQIEPVTAAMQDMTQAASASVLPSLAPASASAQAGIGGDMPQLAGAGGGMVLNFAPNITIEGISEGAQDLREQVLSALRETVPELSRLLENYQSRQNRKRF